MSPHAKKSIRCLDCFWLKLYSVGGYNKDSFMFCHKMQLQLPYLG